MTIPSKPTGSSAGKGDAVAIESVASVLQRELDDVIAEWFGRIQKAPDLMDIKMSREDRTGHLRLLLTEIIKRLRMDAGTTAPISEAAAKHGDLRRNQGYTPAMAVEESRLLEVSIFTILQNNANFLEFKVLLLDVATIVDEVDAQLKEQMLRFTIAGRC